MILFRAVSFDLNTSTFDVQMLMQRFKYQKGYGNLIYFTAPPLYFLGAFLVFYSDNFKEQLSTADLIY